jgi:hypothetical protein
MPQIPRARSAAVPVLPALLGALMMLAGCQGMSPTEPGGRTVTVEDVTEALFLGTGPASEGGSPGNVWNSFPRGSAVRLRVASSVDPAALPHLERQVAELNDAFGGFLSLQLSRSAEPDPRPSFHEITLAEVPADEVAELSGEPGAGGTCREVTLAGPLIVDARCLIAAGGDRQDAYVHEVGHGLGFQHVRDGVIAAMMNPSAPVSDFTPIELEAIHRVFTSGLEPGATRVDFLRLGLIRGS